MLNEPKVIYQHGKAQVSVSELYDPVIKISNYNFDQSIAVIKLSLDSSFSIYLINIFDHKCRIIHRIILCNSARADVFYEYSEHYITEVSMYKKRKYAMDGEKILDEKKSDYYDFETIRNKYKFIHKDRYDAYEKCLKDQYDLDLDSDNYLTKRYMVSSEYIMHTIKRDLDLNSNHDIKLFKSMANNAYKMIMKSNNKFLTPYAPFVLGIVDIASSLLVRDPRANIERTKEVV